MSELTPTVLFRFALWQAKRNKTVGVKFAPPASLCEAKRRGSFNMQIKAELTFPGELKDEAIICNLCKQFNIIVNIVEASFSTDTGWAILIFNGSEEELKKAFEYLQTKGVRIENAQKTS